MSKSTTLLACYSELKIASYLHKTWLLLHKTVRIEGETDKNQATKCKRKKKILYINNVSPPHPQIGKRANKIKCFKLNGKKTLKSKQRNTAIFGAKNIDLLEFCTTNNNHFGGKTAARIGTKERNNNNNDEKKGEWSSSTTEKRHIHTHTYESNQLQLQTKIKFIAKHYFNGCGFSYASCRYFFFAFSFQIIYAIRMDIDFDGRKYFCHNVGNFYLARHVAMNCSNQLVLNAKLVFGTIETPW